MVSYEVALNFISETLGINDMELKLESNKLSLLNEMIRAHHQHIPFQNLSLLATDQKERCSPTLENCIADCRKGIGGMCVTLNGFFLSLLQALGFNACLVTGNLPQSKIRDFHVMIVVSDIEESGDKYYVDVGLGFPTFVAIPIHTLEDGQSDIYQFAFHTVRIAREGDTYIRYQKKRVSEDPEDQWLKAVEFENIARDFSFFDESMTIIYSDKNISHFLKFMFASIYPPGKAVTFIDLSVEIWDEETESGENINFDSTEEASEKLSELFPMIPIETIKNGFNEWLKSENEKEATT